ncbi:MAG TPA: SDR family oxidoreductase [Bryobacteraceae bacterium]|nr:SDR family oxidoreductase [Bryobacteraceae bacterium]
MKSGTILVTGASGLLGANLVSTLVSRGETVVAQFLAHPVSFASATGARIDITDRASVRSFLSEVRPAWVVHGAAATNVDWCEENPEWCNRINIDGARHVAEAARMAGSRLLFVSTDSVFDGQGENYRETDAVQPLNVYGRSKLLAETCVREELPSALIVRTNMFGISPRNKLSLAEWILDRLHKGLEVPGFLDVFFSPLLANDLAGLMLDLMNGEREGIYHLGSCDRCSKHEFALRIARTFGLNESKIHGVPAETVGLLAPRPKDTSLCTGKAAQTMGRAMPSVQAGIDRMKELIAGGFRDRLKTVCPGPAAITMEV